MAQLEIDAHGAMFLESDSNEHEGLAPLLGRALTEKL